MLNAILHGKKRGTGTAGVRLSEAFNGLEDILTATVFERLFYLPDELASEVLFAENIWDRVPRVPPTPIEKVSFWPWQTIEGEYAVEPDLVIEFSDRVLVIEAKRNDFVSQQSSWQLAREYRRAHALFPGRNIWILAVGGLSDGIKATKISLRNAVLGDLASMPGRLHEQDIHFAAVAWHELFKIIYDATLGMDAYRRLVSDIREGLMLHGIGVDPPSWLNELTLPGWRAFAGTTPPKAFATLWVTELARFRPITSSITVFSLPEAVRL